MYICYPTIYDMTMLALVSYMKILIGWKYPVYPDIILNKCYDLHESHDVSHHVCAVEVADENSTVVRWH
jgi:hypothetical protein